MTVPSCFVPAGSTPSLASSSTGAIPNVCANPYGTDEYDKVLGQIRGICTLFDIALQNVIRAVPDGVRVNEERENRLSAEIDDYDRQLRALTQNLVSLHNGGTKPRNWGYSQDGVIGSVLNLFKTSKRLSEDNAYNNPGRKIRWHFRGPMEALDAMKEELINCCADFSQYSDYTQTRTGPFFPPEYETRRLLAPNNNSKKSLLETLP